MDLNKCKKCRHFIACNENLVACKSRGYITHWDILDTLQNTKEVILCPRDSFLTR